MMKSIDSEKITEEVALEKAKKYCAGQEHCQQDVIRKLYEWNAGDFIGIITEKLTKEGFISDRRYAELFTRSKINQNKWGRVKIEAALRSKNVASPLIKDAFEKINLKDYLQNLKTLFLKKERELKEPDRFNRQQKITMFLVSKGYEPDLIYKLFNTK